MIPLRVLAALIALVLMLPGFAAAFESETFAAPVEHVWTVALATLEAQGWGIDEQDPALGRILSRSHRLQGIDFSPAAYALTRRMRLVVVVEPTEDGTATVTVDRQLFDRERMFWIRHDDFQTVRDPLMAKDRALERSVLAAIRRGL